MRVKSIKYIKDYKLELMFSDSKVKIVDLENLIKKGSKIYDPLKDLNFFKQVALDDCQFSICWPNGADICPNVLYAIGKDLGPSNELIPKSSKKTSFRRKISGKKIKNSKPQVISKHKK